MNSATLRLVLVISSAHALVHVYELSLPSLELEIAGQYYSDPAEGKRSMGLLSTCWRMPFGFGALLAGWLIDRWGPRRMLVAYLAGCSAACLILAFRQPLPLVFVAMAMMGTFACIYHPAGLTLISYETEDWNRARALGIHGIFGSAGIAAAPFLVGLALAMGANWRQCYLVLALPGVLLGLLLVQQLRRPSHTDSKPLADTDAHWPAFLLLTLTAVLQGFVYAGVLSFLPRYLAASSLAQGQLSIASYSTTFVLLLGCLGQYAAGRLAQLRLLERQLVWVVMANAPLLVWMAVAQGNQRILAAASFSLVHFMYQPIYNSLVAQYTPASRRSLCYGFAFAMSFGVGGLGATWVGFSPDERTAYTVLSCVAAGASLLALLLWLQNRQLAATRGGGEGVRG